MGPTTGAFYYTFVVDSPHVRLKVINHVNGGFGNVPMTVEITVWGVQTELPQIEEIKADRLKLLPASDKMVPVDAGGNIVPIDLSNWDDVRVAYSVTDASGSRIMTAPVVTIFGNFISGLMPIDSILSAGDAQIGGSKLLLTAPKTINLKFVNPLPATGARNTMLIEWVVYGYKKRAYELLERNLQYPDGIARPRAN